MCFPFACSFISHLQVKSAQLTPEGIDHLCKSLANPKQRRGVLLKDSMAFTGTDCLRQVHSSLLPCYTKLRDMFYMHLDYVEDHPDFRVPLPTYRRITIEDILSQQLGFQVPGPLHGVLPLPKPNKFVTSTQQDRGAMVINWINVHNLGILS